MCPPGEVMEFVPIVSPAIAMSRHRQEGPDDGKLLRRHTPYVIPLGVTMCQGAVDWRVPLMVG